MMHPVICRPTASSEGNFPASRPTGPGGRTSA
jgi:hypothetical protein